MHSPRLYKYRDSYGMYIPTLTHLQFGITYKHSFVYRNTYMTFPPLVENPIY